jgi:hypothetical protein
MVLSLLLGTKDGKIKSKITSLKDPTMKQVEDAARTEMCIANIKEHTTTNPGDRAYRTEGFVKKECNKCRGTDHFARSCKKKLCCNPCGSNKHVFGAFFCGKRDGGDNRRRSPSKYNDKGKFSNNERRGRSPGYDGDKDRRGRSPSHGGNRRSPGRYRDDRNRSSSRERNYGSARRVSDDRSRRDEPPTYKDAIEKGNDDERRGSYDDRRYSDDDKGRDENSRYTMVERNYKTTVDQYTDVNEFGVDYYSLWSQEDYFMYYYGGGKEDTIETCYSDKETVEEIQHLNDKDEEYECMKTEVPNEIILHGKSRRIEDELLLTFEQGNFSFDYGSVPDTGSSLGVMAFNVAKRNKIRYDTEVKVNLRNASGKYMDVVGLATVWSKPKYINGKLNKHDRRRIQSKYVVTRDMHNEILVSREDLKRFGVIPDCFPRVEVLQTKVEMEIETEIEKPVKCAKNIDLPVKADKEMKMLLNKYKDVKVYICLLT